eukprot:763574-Hanusia_phi.AAC.9
MLERTSETDWRTRHQENSCFFTKNGVFLGLCGFDWKAEKDGHDRACNHAAAFVSTPSSEVSRSGGGEGGGESTGKRGGGKFDDVKRRL